MSDARTSQAPADEADYREQVLERFTMRARALTNQFTILMIFAFGFLVFVIVPLAALNFDAAHVAAQKAEIEALTAQSEELEAERAALEEEVGILRGNIGSLNSVLEDKRQDAEERTGARGTLKKRLADNGADRQRLLTQAQGLESAVNGIKKTLASFDADQRVDGLRNWFYDTAFDSNRDPACEDTEQRVYLRCLVKKKLEADWDRDFSLIRREVIEPLNGIAPAIAGAIEGELSAVKKTFGERLEANQDFWQSITGKELFMDGLSDDFNQAFENITGIVNLRLDKIAQQSTRLEAEIAELAQAGQALEDDLAVLDEELKAIQAETEAKFQELGDKESAIEGNEREQAKLTEQVAQIQEQLATLPDPEDIEQEREDIEERLASFESPFGVIPIGLKEAVLAYPLILAAGFMVCVLLLARLLALRREFRNSLARDQALSEADVDRRVATLAPLWFDAGRAFWANPAMVLALLIPFVLFVASGWLILNDWLLQLGDTASATNLRAFYAGLYALGLAIFVAGLLRVQSAWAQDRAMPASANPVPPA
jgi:cell division protein FtsB